MSIYNNPFPTTDTDRHALWTMLVKRDIDAFVDQNWELIADDFIETGFTAINASGSINPDSWRLPFATLDDYRQGWLEQARQLNAHCDSHTLQQTLYGATILHDVEVNGDAAIVHKKFDGEVVATNGERIPLKWQTIYHCTKIDGRWKIRGFVGYLPYPILASVPFSVNQPKQIPTGAQQHTTAGPYSPVLIVNPGSLVVISGQAAIDHTGRLVGNTIESQTRITLDNCQSQLATAGCNFSDVFKVNVYLRDIADWTAFNEVYTQYLPDPKPVRTAIEAKLLPDLLVEVEMWAVKA